MGGRAMLAVAWLCIGLWSAAWGKSASTGLYNEANALYHRGEFEAARQKYLQAAAAGGRDLRLYYNLGNACFKAKRLGEAILWYERALRIDPRDVDTRANLRFANQVKKDRDPGEDNALWRFVVEIYLLPSLDELSLAFSAALALFFALALRRLWQRRRNEGLRLVLMLSCGGLWALTGVFLGMRVYRQEHRSEAIITAPKATARSAPDQSKTAVFVVHEGTKVRVDRREGDWLLIRLANGLGGWLPLSELMLIESGNLGPKPG